MNLGRLTGFLAASIALTGCGIGRVDSGPVDDLSTWSKLPLPADQALATRAAQGPSSCRAAGDDKPVRILLQDRRTAWTADFLFTAGAQIGRAHV